MFCSVHNLFAMLSSPTPADQSLYYHIDYPTGMYSRRVGGNSLDVIERVIGEKPFSVLFHKVTLAVFKVHFVWIMLCIPLARSFLVQHPFPIVILLQ